MKKIIKIITPLLAVLFLLTACAGEKTKVFIETNNNNNKTLQKFSSLMI